MPYEIEQIFHYQNSEDGGKAPPPKIYFIGIKGTGMCALAQLLKHLGYQVLGSDVTEHFYTDELLEASGITYHKGFRAKNLPSSCDLVIYSAAYDSSNPEYAAAQISSLAMLSYPEALAHFSRSYEECIAVAGVHGKTTSTLLLSSLMQSLNIKGTALAGAGALHLGGKAFLAQGTDLLAIETCEYRNHFLHFQPSVVLLISLEWDHQDFFINYPMMQQSFRNFLEQDSVQTVVYCADDLGVRELILQMEGQGLPEFLPYGFAATGNFALKSIEQGEGETVMHLQNFPEHPLRLKVPGAHLALNALGGLAALFQSRKKSCKFSEFPDFPSFLAGHYQEICCGLENFSGASRRSELLGEIPWGEGSVLVLDDYGHHPTAVAKTLQGLKAFYPRRRLVLDFMSHTYTRTKSLHREFSECFHDADQLILHEIYGSAREQEGSYSGKVLWQAVNVFRQQQGLPPAYYFDQPLDALAELQNILQPGDLFVTMGAGSNRELALALLKQ